MCEKEEKKEHLMNEKDDRAEHFGGEGDDGDQRRRRGLEHTKHIFQLDSVVRVHGGPFKPPSLFTGASWGCQNKSPLSA